MDVFCLHIDTVNSFLLRRVLPNENECDSFIEGDVTTDEAYVWIMNVDFKGYIPDKSVAAPLTLGLQFEK